MSMIRCDNCQDVFDSDDDPDCFVGHVGVLCWSCRPEEDDDDPDSAEVQIERRADFIIRELDEFCAMASNHETVDLIENEKIAVGQMQTRCQLILSFLAARSVPKFKVISNG